MMCCYTTLGLAKPGYSVLFHAMLNYAMLQCVSLRYTTLHFAMLSYPKPWCDTPRCLCYAMF
eukprot:3223931-Karenia_brevis.AAC.1